jgi:transcriptional regulator with XRE-family HTH domain
MIGANMADVLRLTYRELARRLGLTPDGARFLAKRRMWPIENGNDGRKVIIVAETELAAEVERTAGDRGMNGASGQVDDVLAELRERLDHEVVELRQRVDELNKKLGAAQAQVADLRVELATALGEVAARDAVQAELRAQVAWLRRPWWRKLLSVTLLLGLMAMMNEPISAQGYEPKGRQESSVEYLATRVRVNHNSATMYEHRNYYVTRTSGPVGAEGIPSEIQLGDTVEVNGRQMRVGLIVVTEYLEDMEWSGQILARKGQVACAAVENAENLPWVDEDAWRNRLWIDIQNCTVLKAAP